MILIRGNVEREADGVTADKLMKEGFKPIEGTVVEAVPSEPDMEKNLEEMTVDELKALAKAKGLTGVSGLAKKELLDILKA